MTNPNITAPILATHPRTQAVYLYGTWGTEHQRQDSDIDIAVLLPHDDAKQVERWQWHQLSTEVAGKVHAEYADLINLRCVDTTFQAEILRSGRLIHCIDEDARLDFETFVLSRHQKLNRERAGIHKEIINSGRVLVP